MQKQNIIAALLIAIGIAVGNYFIANGIITHQWFNRYVAVKGSAEQIVKSDEANWQITFSYADDDITKVYSGIANSQNTVKNFLIKVGFAENEISLNPVSLTDNQSTTYNNNTQAKRYNANAGVAIQTDKIDAVQSSIQKIGDLVQQGVIINNSSVQYRFTKLNDIKNEMLTIATNNAKKAAETFAKNSDSNLGSIKKADQGMITIQGISGDAYDQSTVMKKVRVVTSIEYFLK
jgi:uncharacterized protein